MAHTDIQTLLALYNQERVARARIDAQKRAAFALGIRATTAAWLREAAAERRASAADSEKRRQAELVSLRRSVQAQLHPPPEPAVVAVRGPVGRDAAEPELDSLRSVRERILATAPLQDLPIVRAVREPDAAFVAVPGRASSWLRPVADARPAGQPVSPVVPPAPTGAEPRALREPAAPQRPRTLRAPAPAVPAAPVRPPAPVPVSEPAPLTRRTPTSARDSAAAPAGDGLDFIARAPKTAQAPVPPAAAGRPKTAPKKSAKKSPARAPASVPARAPVATEDGLEFTSRTHKSAPPSAQAPASAAPPRTESPRTIQRAEQERGRESLKPIESPAAEKPRKESQMLRTESSAAPSVPARLGDTAASLDFISRVPLAFSAPPPPPPLPRKQKTKPVQPESESPRRSPATRSGTRPRSSLREEPAHRTSASASPEEALTFGARGLRD